MQTVSVRLPLWEKIRHNVAGNAMGSPLVEGARLVYPGEEIRDGSLMIADIYVSETVAQDVEPLWNKGY